MRGQANNESRPSPTTPFPTPLPSSPGVGDVLATTPLFARVFERSPVGMIITSVEDSRIVAVNPAYASLLGYAREQLLGKTPVEVGLLGPEAYSAALAVRRAAAGLGHLPIQLIGRDGLPRDLVASFQRTEMDGRAYTISVVQNLSEGSRLRAALATAETRFRRFFDNAPLALIVRDAASETILDVNTTACQQYGYSRAEFLALPPQHLPIPGDGVGGLPPLARHTAADGRQLFFEVTSFAFDLDNRRARMDALVNVTDRVLAAAALRDSQERLRLITDGSSDGLWEWDLTTNTLWHNRGSLLADLAANAPLEAWTERIHPDDLAHLMAEFASQVSAQAPGWTTEYRARRPDGSWANLLQRAIIGYEDGRPVRIVGSIVDITGPLRLAEAEAHTAQVERERLTRDLHDSVTQSLYSASLLAEAARRQMEGHPQDAAAEYVIRFGQLIHTALRQMRLLLYELRPAVFEQEGLIGALNHRLESVEKRAGLRATLLIRGEAAPAKDAQSELYWVAHEALNNALRHAAATAVTVTLDTRGERVILEISDNGRGFAPDEPHAGLGLAGMRERGERLGGTLTVLSRPGRGTSVRLTAPLTS